MEKEPTKFINLEKQYLQIDKENLESQLIKISEVLLKISENNYFNTFSHFKKLADISTKTNISPINGVELLENWDYKSLDFIQTEKCGNCVDFAVLCQKMLLDVGVPTTIIGRSPEIKDFTKRQADYIKYKHIAPLYANDSNGLKIFLLEPSWKFSKPIPISQGSSSVYKEWRSEVSNINDVEFIQKAYNPKKDKYRERLFNIHPLNIDVCSQLTKNFIRVPRELKILNTKDEEIIKFVKFDPIKQIFTTNINGVSNEFLPSSLTLEQSKILEDKLEQPGLLEYLSKVFDFLKLLPNDFWIKE